MSLRSDCGPRLDGGHDGEQATGVGVFGGRVRSPNSRAVGGACGCHVEGRQATYGTYLTEDLAADAQARWRLTHLLPADDPEQAVELPASVAVGGVCDEWFVRWQEPRRLGGLACGSTTSAGEGSQPRARDRAYWSKWWAPTLGLMLPHMVIQPFTSDGGLGRPEGSAGQCAGPTLRVGHSPRGEDDRDQRRVRGPGFRAVL